ncbi:MAG: type III pantothenate kinase [Bacteroidales bacterium]
MNLAIDIGNTLVKLAVFEKGQMTALQTFEEISTGKLERFISSHQGITSSIIATVKDFPDEIKEYLQENTHFILFDIKAKLPITSTYNTPETLGVDRLAAAVAAHSIMPSETLLIISAGTAITYDVVSAGGIHYGGAISPGLLMRFKALHNFTGRLPLMDQITDTALIGQSTADSILSGVLNGALAEVDGMIEKYSLQYPGLKTILSGGDNKYFDKRLKNKTFAIPNLALTGLNIILEYNIEKSL